MQKFTVVYREHSLVEFIHSNDDFVHSSGVV